LHNGISKISDFGFARVIETGMNGKEKYIFLLLILFIDPSYFSRVGSPLYMSP